MGQVLRLSPGSKMVVSVVFNAVNENEVVIEDFPAGQSVFSATNHGPDGHPKTWESPVNEGGEAKLYRIVARHKTARPGADGHLPWLTSRDRVLFADGVTQVIGYEDGADDDYNDVTATVMWR